MAEALTLEEPEVTTELVKVETEGGLTTVEGAT